MHKCDYGIVVLTTNNTCPDSDIRELKMNGIRIWGSWTLVDDKWFCLQQHDFFLLWISLFLSVLPLNWTGQHLTECVPSDN